MLGNHVIGATAAPLAPSSAPLTTVEDTNWEGLPLTLGRLILTEGGQDVDIGGNASVFGTTAPGEVIGALGGTVHLDGSFNAGGDTVALAGASGDYVATLSGSFVTITDGDANVAIPVGLAGLTVDFSDIDLELGVEGGQVMIGDNVLRPEA